MELVIRNKRIDAPIMTILTTLKSELHNGLLKDIDNETQDNIPVTCPVHKNGRENRPSCYVYCRRDNDKVEYGRVHCFTCGYSVSLPEFVGDCFGQSVEFGKSWLIGKFGTFAGYDEDYLEPIILEKNKKKYLDESVLNNYMFYHPYMWKRGLSKEVVDRFGIGFDKSHNAITFPVWDESGNLVMITSRNVSNKYFHIEKNKDKPVYLLNYVNQDKPDRVYVVESQINALTLWSWGYPAVALFGTGSSHQYDILNKSGIRNYVLCFDGDIAGLKGMKRFTDNIRSDVLVSYKVIPEGKDVNDLTKEQFEKLDEIFL
jgi:DNA primase